MHPLTRQPTLDSVLSWWSDSNPVGPTISIHAAAKPLMRRMYHRDALAFIRKNHDIPLTNETLQIYSSYLSFKYVSPATKIAILEELSGRADFPPDALVIANSPVLYCVHELSRALDPEVRSRSCSMLARLASHPDTVTVILSILNPCVQLVSLLRDGAADVSASAASALRQITHLPQGAQATVDANILDHVEELLQSPRAMVRRQTCDMLSQLASHESTTIAVLRANCCLHLVSLLRDANPLVVAGAAGALHCISKSPAGRKAVIQADVAARLLELLGSSSVQVQMQTCKIMAELARDESTAVAVLAVPPCIKLVSLFRDDNSDVMKSATEALYWIATSRGGARAAINANILDGLADLLDSRDDVMQRRIIDMLEQLAYQQPKSAAVVQLVTLLRRGYLNAIKVLGSICITIDGAQAAVDANVLQFVGELLNWPNAELQRWTCEFLGHLATHENTADAIFNAKLFPQLGSLLRHEDPDVVESANGALCQIAQSSRGVEGMVDANILAYVAELLASSNANIRDDMAFILGCVAHHESEAIAILAVKHCQQLVSLLRDESSEVIERSVYALCYITRFPQGATAALDAGMLKCIVELLASPNAKIRGKACLVVGFMASHEATAAAVLAVKPCPPLVSCLRFEDSNEATPTLSSSSDTEAATHALSQITRLPNGAQATVDANFLDCIPMLLEASNMQVRRWTCRIIGHLIKHEASAIAVLGVNPCLRVASLLRSEEDGEVMESAARALHSIVKCKWFEGTEAAGNMKILECLGGLVGSSDPEARRWACRILRYWPFHPGAAASNVSICLHLVSLLRHENVGVVGSAAQALTFITKFPRGGKAAADANVLHGLPELLESPEAGVRTWACKILSDLAHHEEMAVAALTIGPCIQLVSAWKYLHVPVRLTTFGALAKISEARNGAAAIGSPNILAHISELLESTDWDAKFQTCVILRNLARNNRKDIQSINNRADLRS
ncbi:armadillo-type protein [Mycena latifolia]|nr:armadillo-type protein [Mycena latifolia]